MKYLTPEEIRSGRGNLKVKFKTRPDDKVFVLREKNLALFTEAVPDKSAAVLDFGVGSGDFLRTLQDLGYTNLYGSDIDNYITDTAINIREFKAFDASFEKFPWPDNTFDAVASWETFEHLENPHNAIREIRRILKPGGFLVISIPNIFHIVSRLIFLKRGLFPRWNETNNHISVYPRGIFDKAFLRYFSLVKATYPYPQVQLPLIEKIKFLPANKWFGNWVNYALKKK